MRKKAGKTKPAPKPKHDQAWFDRKYAELSRAVGKLPADRQEQLEREIAEQD